MKSTIFLLTLFVFSLPAFGGLTCKDIEQEYSYWGLREVSIAQGNVLTVANWKSFDVVASFEYERCVEFIDQKLLQIGDELFWMFYSTEDFCDGGNTYGSIYTFDLSEVVAHIYDQDIVCEENWRKEELAENHQCDLPAILFAQNKMKNFGFDFVPEGALMDLQKGFSFSTGKYVFISVSGKIKGKKKPARVKVRGFIPVEGGCNLLNASIDHIPL